LGIEEATTYYQAGLELVRELERRLKLAENTITHIRETEEE
jgi:exonuclease VII small subunit